MTTKLFPRLALIGALAAAGTMMPQVAAAQTTPAAETVPGARATTRAQAGKYAEREQKSAAELEKFEGGAVVLVVSTLGAIVLGAILLIILL